MAFTVHEFKDLIVLLDEHPEWRADLRRVTLPEDLVELPPLVRDLAEAQRQTEESIKQLAEAQRRTEEREGQLFEAQQRTEERLQHLENVVSQLVEEVRALVEQVRALTEVQQHRHTDSIGKLTGQLLELTFRDKAHAYWGHLMRRLRPVRVNDLEDALESSLSPGEFRDVFRLDLLLQGQPRHQPSGKDLFLAVEISKVVDQNDVDRAERCTKLLQKSGFITVPVVAGEQATLGAENSAREQKVVLVRDGQVSFWEDALQAWVV